MTLHYHWENVTVNKECDYPNAISPHTRPIVEDVDHDYDVDITVEDIVDYLSNRKMTDEQKYWFKIGIENALELLGHNYDNLEEDEYFIEFMTAKYHEKAWEDFQEGNEAY